MAGSAHAAHAAAMANAIKASGVVVRMEAVEWLGILKRIEAPLVVVGRGGVFRKHFQYLTSHRGLAFFTTSPTELVLPGRVDVVAAGKISIPDI
jgi:hypothetical protein